MAGERPTFTQPQHAEYEAAIRKVVPETFFKRAAEIVQAHKPTDPALTNFEPQLSLKPQHHGELNSWKFQEGQPVAQREARFAELRREYASDPEALEQIDIYDSTSPYRAKIREYRDALKSGDAQKEAELDAWFQKNYPHATNRGW